MKIHEFWLKAHQEEYGHSENTDIYRVALGELIDAIQRKTFPPQPSYAEAPNPDYWNKSGSIGFMDITVKSHLIPREDARRLSDYEKKKALTIERIGIEPEYQRKGYAKFLKKRPKKLRLNGD